MKLAAYLKKKKLSMAEFAVEVEVSLSTISRLARGRQCPKLELIERIRVATKGQVKANDLFTDQVAGGSHRRVGNDPETRAVA